MHKLLKGCISRKQSRQSTLEAVVDVVLRRDPSVLAVVDLGCGAGNSVDYFRRKRPEIRWIGLDIADSPEVRGRKREDADFRTFDGVNIPLADSEVDLFFCKQVLEHVVKPQELLHEVERCLRPGGYLAASTSQFEPFHSYSVWNYTPYGIKTMLDDVGLRLEEVHPGIDGLTLMARRALGHPKCFSKWWASESPLNRAINLYARLKRLNPAATNAVKLLFCGQFSFLARKPLRTSVER